MTFSDKVKAFRAQTATPIRWFAGLFGVSAPTFRAYEQSGRLVPTPEITRVLSDISGIPEPDWLSDEVELDFGILPSHVPARGRPQKPERSLQLSPDEEALLVRINQKVSEQFDSSRAFAQHVRMDETRLSRLLSGKLPMLERELLRIAMGLDVTVSWLKTGINTAAVLTPLHHDGQQLGQYLLNQTMSWTDLQQAMRLSSLSSVTGPKGYSSRPHIRPDTKAKIAHALGVSASVIWPPLSSGDSIPVTLIESPAEPTYSPATLSRHLVPAQYQAELLFGFQQKPGQWVYGVEVEKKSWRAQGNARLAILESSVVLFASTISGHKPQRVWRLLFSIQRRH
jgi:transcriptional regulator with XRE-family HTH domain